MKIGIDSYCYHRQFGDWYAGLQDDPGRRWTVWDFLAAAQGHGAEGVSLEACYLGDHLTPAGLERLRAALDAAGLVRVWAWGHPDGLHSGADPDAASDAVADLERHIGHARAVGAGVMRICAGSRRTRPASSAATWAEHRDRLLPLLRRAAGPAAEAGVVLAVENHIDLLADELAELVTLVGSPWLRVCLDTANGVRMGEDALTAVRTLAPFAAATHVKDIVRRPGDAGAFASWPSVPLGRGVVGIAAVLEILRAAGFAGLLAVEIDYLDPAWLDPAWLDPAWSAGAEGAADSIEDAAVADSLRFLRGLRDAPGV